MNALCKRFVMLVLAGLLVAAGGCAANEVDDEGGAHVVLEIQILDNPPVTATLDQMTGICTFEVEEWTANANNVPKNALAVTSPFNDIVLLDLTIEYSCDPAGSPCMGVTSPRVFGLTGTVPAASSLAFTFTPIFLDDLNLAIEGTTLNLRMTFRAETVVGDEIILTTADTLSVETCA